MLARTVKAGHETRLDVSKYIFSQLSSPPSWDGNSLRGNDGLRGNQEKKVTSGAFTTSQSLL